MLSKDGDKNTVRNIPITIALFRENIPAWIEHPSGAKVDCVAIPFEMPGNVEIKTNAINEGDFVKGYKPSIGDDCFIVGYPKGLEAGFRTPIWKRGSVASEPQLNVDGKPMFLVDSASRKGMSGSPVIVRHKGIFHPNGVLEDESVFGEMENFAGIYSGRSDDDELGVQLGRIWKPEVLNELFSNVG